MRSAVVLDHPTTVAEGPEVRDLLVLWQHPHTRELVPIGRFTYDGHTYSFAYTRAAEGVADLRPLPGLNDLRVRYVSERIPPVFAQRVMQADRPDFAEYVDTLGLDRARATPWEQIVQSGGIRAGDTLQFMQVPLVENGRARARFLVNGVSHMCEGERRFSGRTMAVTPEQHESALQRLAVGDSVLVEAEDDNPKDPSATLVTSEGIPIGWVPRAMSPAVRELMQHVSVRPTVARIGPPGTSPHLRLVLDLDVPAPADFAFDRDGRWIPLSSQ
ncbi:hypothetical protein FB474_0119 [Oryzihumus leptocrescens]|uniref:HIRAN domain-containing protein n=1 Tax=Oryzihumus leptocrescens TaxID=297536 RepID=A0A542ZEP8_9MICO|nr:hypothetical protein FB474_0119 [Oryzihumus leptocrescens]